VDPPISKVIESPIPVLAEATLKRLPIIIAWLVFVGHTVELVFPMLSHLSRNSNQAAYIIINSHMKLIITGQISVWLIFGIYRLFLRIAT
jgi:uncharacterized membrane protein YqhA